MSESSMRLTRTLNKNYKLSVTFTSMENGENIEFESPQEKLQ